MNQILVFLKTKIWAKALVLTSLFFLATYLCFGCYYVEYEGLNTGLISGKLTPGLPFKSFFFIGNLGLSYVYSYIYSCSPHIEWLSYFYLIYLFVSNYLGIYLICRLVGKSISPWGLLGLTLGCYVLILMDHNISLIYTRVSYLVCAITLFSLLVLYKEKGSLSKKWALYLLLNLFFLIGALTRIEASLAVLALIFCFGFFYYDSILSLAKILLLPALITLSLVFYASESIKSIHEFYAQVEPDVEAQYVNRHNIIPLSEMKNKSDSVKYQAARYLMWSDPQIISAEYLRSLIRKDEKPLFLDKGQWQRVLSVDMRILTNNKILTIGCLFLSIMVFAAYRKRNTYRTFLLLSWLSSFWILIIIQTYIFKLNDRSYIPLISVFMFGHILLLADKFSNRFFAVKPYLFGLFAILVMIYFTDIVRKSIALKSQWITNKKNYDLIKTLTKDKILVLNASSFDNIFLANRPFREFDLGIAQNIYIIDAYTLPFMPYYRAYLERDFKCSVFDFAAMITHLKTTDREVIFLSDSSRVKVMADYLKTIRGVDLKLMPDTTIYLNRFQDNEYIERRDNTILYRLVKE
jgi:hypothetical protein